MFFAQLSQLISGDERPRLPGPLRFVFLDALDHVLKYHRVGTVDLDKNSMFLKLKFNGQKLFKISI